MRVFALLLLCILILGIKKDFTDAAIRREASTEDMTGLDQDKEQGDNFRALGDHHGSHSYFYHHHHHGHHHDHHYHHYEIYVSSKGGKSSKSGKGGKGHYVFYHGWPVEGSYPPSKSGKGKGKGGKGKGGKGKGGKGSKGSKGGKGKSSPHGYGW